MGVTTKTKRQQVDRKVITALRKHFKGVKTVTLGAKAYALAALVAVFQANVDVAEASDTARKSWLTSVDAAKNNERKTAPVRSTLRDFVLGTFGATSQVIADFGFKPRKAHKVSVKKKAAAVEKTLATRAARHTMGKREKAKIVGTAPSPDGAKPVASSATNGSGGPRGTVE